MHLDAEKADLREAQNDDCERYELGKGKDAAGEKGLVGMLHFGLAES